MDNVKTIMLIDKSGLPLYYYNRGKENEDLDDALFSGVLTAIDSILNETFNVDEQKTNGFLQYGNMYIYFTNSEKVIGVYFASILDGKLVDVLTRNVKIFEREVRGYQNLLKHINEKDSPLFEKFDLFKTLSTQPETYIIQPSFIPTITYDGITQSKIIEGEEDFLKNIDGKSNLLRISEKSGMPLEEVIFSALALYSKGTIEFVSKINWEYFYKITVSGEEILLNEREFDRDYWEARGIKEEEVHQVLNAINPTKTLKEIALQSRNHNRFMVISNKLYLRGMIINQPKDFDLAIRLQRVFIKFTKVLLEIRGKTATSAIEKIIKEKNLFNLYPKDFEVSNLNLLQTKIKNHRRRIWEFINEYIEPVSLILEKNAKLFGKKLQEKYIELETEIREIWSIYKTYV